MDPHGFFPLRSCRPRRSRPWFGLGLLWLLCLFASAQLSPLAAQIGYVQIGRGRQAATPAHECRWHGRSPDRVALHTFVFPTFSRDGTQLAVSAYDPALPIQRSQNVFSLSTATGAVSQLTFYGDLVSDGVIIYNFPNYKAFSPEQHGAGGLRLYFHRQPQ